MTATDRTFRAMARAEPDTLLALLRVIAPQLVPHDATVAPIDVLASWTDLPPPTDADWVAKIARWRRIVHVECQGYRDTTFLRRVVHYHAGLALRFPTWRVMTFALWLLRPPRRQRTDVITVGALSVKVTSVVLREIPVATLLTSPVTACFAPVGDPESWSPEEVCARTARVLVEHDASWYQWSVAQTMAAVVGWESIMKQAIQKLERPDIILIDLVKYGEDKGKAKGRRVGRREGMREGKREGKHEGKLDVFALMFERRLGRALTVEQRAEIERRLGALGPERLSDVVLDLSARKLAAWLADPDSR